VTWLLLGALALEGVIMLLGFRHQSRKMREHEDNPRHHLPRPF
jgi:hypothetical protein